MGWVHYQQFSRIVTRLSMKKEQCRYLSTCNVFSSAVIGFYGYFGSAHCLRARSSGPGAEASLETGASTGAASGCWDTARQGWAYTGDNITHVISNNATCMLVSIYTLHTVTNPGMRLDQSFGAGMNSRGRKELQRSPSKSSSVEANRVSTFSPFIIIALYIPNGPCLVDTDNI